MAMRWAEVEVWCWCGEGGKEMCGFASKVG